MFDVEPVGGATAISVLLKHPADPQFLMSLAIYSMGCSPFGIPITVALRVSGTAFQIREIPN